MIRFGMIRSALSSVKIDKYEYLTDKEILPSNQQQIIDFLDFLENFLDFLEDFSNSSDSL